MPMLFSDAETAQQFAERLIPTYHPHLATARIKYVFREKAANEGGKPCPGKARKISGLNEFLINQDFVLEIALDLWQEMGESQREALVDHLLEHCGGEEDQDDPGGGMVWKLRKPDVKEFVSVLNRRGTWNESLGDFVQVAQGIARPVEAEVEESVDVETVLNTTGEDD